MILGFERLLLAIVLFYGAMDFCLPIPFAESIRYPWWATRVSIGNIVLHEVVFLVWLGVYGFRFVFRRLLNGGIPTRQAAIFLVALAIWCGLVSFMSPLPLQDLGRSFRLVLMATMLIAVVKLTKEAGDFSLIAFLLGFLAGTLINLVMSFDQPLIINEIMRLSGQNTAAVGMAIAMHLAAWLFLRSSNRKIQTFSIATALVCAFGCGIGFSRVGWLCGVLGLLTWVYIIFFVRLRERMSVISLRRKRKFWIPIFLLMMVTVFTAPVAQESVAWIGNLLVQKDWLITQSNDARSSYAIGTAEIVAKHPLGVGYSGFYDAMIETEIYKSGVAIEEESLDANPHSGFLYYLSAGGIIGGILMSATFVFLLKSMRFGLLFEFGPTGDILFVLAALSFLLIGLTVPYIYNSIIMIVPTAIAAGWGWSRRLQARSV